MRVIAGKARRLNLKTIPGNETRPTTDRIKETLFNILQPEIPGCRFLDLFSGSGGIISAFIIVCLRVGLGQKNVNAQVILLIIGVLLVAAVALPNIIGDVKKAVAMKKN